MIQNIAISNIIIIVRRNCGFSELHPSIIVKYVVFIYTRMHTHAYIQKCCTKNVLLNRLGSFPKKHKYSLVSIISPKQHSEYSVFSYNLSPQQILVLSSYSTPAHSASRCDGVIVHDPNTAASDRYNPK